MGVGLVTLGRRDMVPWCARVLHRCGGAGWFGDELGVTSSFSPWDALLGGVTGDSGEGGGSGGAGEGRRRRGEKE